jgi:hypothetical protein
MQREYICIYVRVLEAVAAARAAEELLGEADVAAHGADGGGGGTSHGDRPAEEEARLREGETDEERLGEERRMGRGE